MLGDSVVMIMIMIMRTTVEPSEMTFCFGLGSGGVYVHIVGCLRSGWHVVSFGNPTQTPTLQCIKSSCQGN